MKFVVMNFELGPGQINLVVSYAMTVSIVLVHTLIYVTSNTVRN